MLDRLLDWIDARGGKREIPRDGKKYLTRYYVWRSKRLTVLIHKFWASDPDEPHDHPWHWISYILRGGYFEHGVDGTVLERNRFKNRFLFRKAEEFHRVEVDPTYVAGDTTTLFITFRRRRSWGFLRGDKWLSAKTYDKEPVDIEGVHFKVVGHLFPRLVWAKPQTFLK